MLDGSLILVKLLVSSVKKEYNSFDIISNIPWDWIEETDSQLRSEGAIEQMLEECRRAQELENDSELEGWLFKISSCAFSFDCTITLL